VLLARGRKRAALARIDRLLACSVDDCYALATQAHLMVELGDRPAAHRILQRLVGLQPAVAAGWFNLGFVSEELGLLEQAEAAFVRATEIDPRFDRAWYGLALSLIRQCRFDEAMAALHRNTELQPMSPHGWYQLAWVHVERQEPEEAARIICHLRGFEPKVAAQLARETGLAAAQA
jgi:tetratricopeptide (TPR) repeat protein